MIDFVNYIFESGISLGLFAMLYFLFLQRETYFRTNRLFLLFALFFSLILPLIHLRILDPKPILLGEVTVTPYKNLLEVVSVYGAGVSQSIVSSISTSTYIISIYLFGLCLFASRMLLRIFQILLLIRRNQVITEQGMKLVLLDREISPFSFLSYVFVSKRIKSQDSWEKMMVHEFEHVKQGHSFDILILEILTVFQWFNPFFWLLKRLMRENHEYLADRAVLAHEANSVGYKKLLLQQFIGPQYQMANNFNYSLIKKRIQMMSKIKSSKIARLKLVGGGLVAMALVVVFACENKVSEQIEKPVETLKITIQDGDKTITLMPESSDKIAETIEFFKSSADYELVSEGTGELVMRRKQVAEEKGVAVVGYNKSATVNEEPVKSIDGEPIFFIVDEMPEFPGGELELRRAIAQSIKYPVNAQEKGIQGKVYVNFVVDKNGIVRLARIVRGVAPSLDQEALRVVSGLPQWKPGKQNGEPVAISYTVPISFVLQ